MISVEAKRNELSIVICCVNILLFISRVWYKNLIRWFNTKTTEKKYLSVLCAQENDLSCLKIRFCKGEA